ncbi:MAX gene-associated protein isoform X7 [Apteryx mantelli]|uniref:MAX gene-associated protein isoform X7 n=1 Tax=Apteryx mantelli TaxID=2696672 RepID=A0ABM4EIP3_9AVES
MEKQQIVLGSRDGGTVSGAAPAFFVILKQQQGNGKADQGILVANRDACALASSVSTPVKSKVKTCLPADCVSGSITVTLDNNSMWNEFYHRNTEMILTKQGRRMFPYCRYWITGLDASQKYILVMDISPVDNHRYKWNGRWWEPSGKAEPHVLGRVFIHPESPSTGQYWMHQPVSFYKLKLTNNTLDQEGHIILHSMHRYLPRLHLVPADKATEVIQLNGPDVHTFTFPQTEFFAVTAYQNIQITQLKIDYNPFAKGFRDDGLNSRPQRDVKQNSNLELEGGSVSSSPSHRGRPAEVDALDLHQRSLDPSFIVQNPSDIDLEKESFNAERDFLGFLDTDLSSGDMPKLKQEVSESPIASSYESSSRVESPLDPSGHFNVVIKEEPVDDYDYESSICTQGISIKQEDTDEETDEYSNTDEDDPIVEKHLRKHSDMDRKDGEFRPRKRVLTSPSGVARAKMLKLDSGKMPVVYLEPCAVTKSTVKISELPQTMLTACKKDKSTLSAILDSLPVCFENHKGSCISTAIVAEELAMRKQSPGSKVSQKYCSIREAQWALSKSPSFSLRGSVSCHFSAKEVCGRKKAGILKNPLSQKGPGTSQNAVSSGPNKRGRPRKLKISKAGRPPKGIGKTVITSKNTSLGPGSILPDVKPDLEDVDGVLFVSFASKEALDIHTVDRVGGEESQNLQAPLLATNDPDCQARIQVLEKELMEELKTLRHKQVIHPSLQEVGLKLNSVDPTMSIDLKYLGVQLPLSYSNYSLWNYLGTNPNSPDTGFPFVSRTGKTNDFTKIKGWRGKLHGASRNEGGSSEGSLKNRSAFCSDKLDEYLENEGKLMETSMGFSSSTPASPVVYQLPTKSTSYVRTLDSVLKKQSTIIPSTSYTFKPVSVSSTSRKTKTQNRQTSSNRVKSSYKPILPSPFSVKQKHNFSASGEKAAKSLSSSSLTNQVDNFMVPALDENVLPKQISLRHAPQQQQAARPPGLSKSQVKLMDLEDCALWDGKPRTYITEERADISLATLLTAQASLKNKPIHKIIRRRAPPCNNDFCRLGCICASLALEKRQPTHCRRPDCMFGCTCLKRRVLLVKGGSKHKKILKKAVRGNLVFYGTQEEQQDDEDVEEEGNGEEDEQKQKDKKKRKRVEYTICDSEPEQPIRNCPLWVKVEGEIDPEPIYIPTPSVIEPVKPVVLPNPEVSLSSRHRTSSGMKPGRVYTPKPNPVIREEDKDPVYLYFESMMTCARVRAYECRREEKKQQKDQCNSKSCSIKEQESDLQPPEKATCEMDKDTDKSGEDAIPQATSKTPQKMSPGAEKRVGPRLLLIPVHQTSPALRPLNNMQLPQRQRMVLQPLRSPGGVNLFRHPNGQIIQLVPLHQFRAAGAQPNVQPVMFRNPGSVVGIRLPAPSKPSESPVSPTSSVSSTSPATNSATQTAGPKFSSTANLATQASSVLPSVPSFVSQAGTLTLRISPPAASSMANQTGSESKITCSSGGQPTTTASLIPLQSGSFALLQLPGQKTVPNSILHHFASLQMKKDSKNVFQKDDSGATQQKENGKASRSEEVEVVESEVTVSDSKPEENEVSVNQSNNVEESASGAITPDRNSASLETAEKDSRVLEGYSDDVSSLQHDISADVVSSDHSYISEKPNDEQNNAVTEEKEDSVHSEAVVEAVSTNSETICGSSDQPLVAHVDSVRPQSLENQETAQLKNRGKEQIRAEHSEKRGKERDVQAPIKEGDKANSGQPQGQKEQDAHLENKEKDQRGTEPPQNKREHQDDASVQLQMERKEYKDSTEAESIREKKGSKSEISSAKEQDNASGEKQTEHTEEGKTNVATQEISNTSSQEQGAVDCQEEMKAVKDIVIHANSSWSKISSIAPALENKSNTGNKSDTSDKGDFLMPEQRAQEPKHHKKGYMPTIDITVDDMEEEEEEEDDDDEEDEKTDDSADEMLDGASDFPSEEEVDVEKVDACEYSEDDEQVDIETVEELSEKINIARLKATAANIRPSKQKYHARNSSDEKLSEKPTKQKPQFWNRKQKTEAEAFAHYRQTHTANERRRRNEMRDLFEKLKRALGLHSLPKVSKCYILKQAYEEIQGLTDQADKLIGQKNLLTRKQDVLIRKVSTLSGKTEEVVLKKLEYIYAKQKAVEAQKKKKQAEPEESVVSSTASTQQEGSSAPSRELGQMAVTNRRGKPLILARKGGHATEDTSSSLTLTAASLVMTPQGQVLTLKSPLVPGQVAAVPSTLLQAELKPRAATTTMTTQPGIASVMIQLPGSTVPVQVKGILTNSTIPITLSTVAGNPVPSTVVTAAEPNSEIEDSFMMPKIVNVTSLAAEGSMSLNLNKNKSSNVMAAAGTQVSEKSLAVTPPESRKSDSILSEEKAKPCPGDSGGDSRSTTGPTKVFFENKDGFPQLRNVSCTKEPPDSFSKKLCVGEFVGSQARKKDSDPGGERLKTKELPFRKLQIKDSRIEMELRKVASAMEEAELDAGELLSSIEESDDTDETLTSLLNEIAFLNQQLNEDASGMSELPSTLNSDFSHGDSEARRGTASDLTAADGSSFQFGHLGGSFKDLSEVPEGGGSISPLLLHLEDDDLTDGDKNSGEPSSEADVLKIVIGAEMKDPLPNLSVTSGGSGKTVTSLVETTSVTPPVLQMKTNPEASNADTLWRPMPKLAPLGLKVANLPVDSEGQSTKVMPLLAPVVAKLAPTGVKTSLSATVQEGQDNKVMPTLAPVVTKLNNTGTLPSNSAGK